jgi:hypothetical protein
MAARAHARDIACARHRHRICSYEGMKPSCLFLPLVPAAALAACGSPTTASVTLDPADGWSGTAEVLVHKPDGTMASRAPITTSSDVAVDDGDTVTVVLHDAGNLALFSSTQVQRGDVIELPIGPLGTAQDVATTVTMPPVTGATKYEVDTPSSNASGNSPTLSVDLPPGMKSTSILGAAESDTAVLAMYGSTSAGIDPSGPSILLADTIPFTSVVVTAQNAPTGAFSFAGGNVVLGKDQLPLPSINGTISVPTGFGDGVDLLAVAFGQTELDITGKSYAAAPTGAVTLDLAMPELPQISAPAIASNTASWTLAGGTGYQMIGVDVGVSSNSNFRWSLQAPAATTSLTLPQLPSDLGAPTAFDSLAVVAVSRSDVGSYADALHVTSLPSAGGHFSERIVTTPSSSAATSHAAAKLGKSLLLGARVR